MIDPFNNALNQIPAHINSKDRGRISRDLQTFKQYLLEVNRKINLVSRQKTGSIIDDLIFDSLAMMAHIEYPHESTLLDIGSGAGFPGMIHKIVYPTLRLISVDSNQRKIEFQKSAAKILGFENFFCHAERIENLPSQNVDFCIARGVGSIAMLMGLASPHLKTGGLLILPTTDDKQECLSYQDSVRQESLTYRTRMIESKEGRAQIEESAFNIDSGIVYQSSLSGRQSKLLILKKL